MDIASFKINDRVYTLFHQSEPIETFDSLTQLSFTPTFPKIFWSHRDHAPSYTAFGSLLEINDIPEIQFQSLIEGTSFAPKFFGGLSFSYPQRQSPWYAYFKDRQFVLPKHLFEETTQGIVYHRLALSPTSFDPPLERFHQPLSNSSELSIISRDDFPSQKQWIQNTKQTLKKLQDKALQKVVLARQTQINLNGELNPYHLLNHLRESQQNGSLFSFQFHPQMTFLGASPENLFVRDHHHLKSEALAGTATLVDAQDLLKSSKDYKEFSYVTDYLSGCFQALCKNFQKGEHDVICLGYLKHLKAYYEGELLPQIKDEHLVKRLHPTPAISGTPQKEAKTYLLEFEPFDRGWYSAPLGCISENHTEFIVGIRSCLATSRQMNLFTGCGMIKDSQPEKEWEELEAKLSLYMNYVNCHVSS